MRARMNNPERMRKKRWQVYSLMPGRKALFVSSFDLRQDAQRLIDRQEGCGDDPLFCGEMRLPVARFVLVDGKEQTVETMSQAARGQSAADRRTEGRKGHGGNGGNGRDAAGERGA